MKTPQDPPQLFFGDCMDYLPLLPARSVALVVADPPYYLQLEKNLWRPDDSLVEPLREDWDQFDSYAAYDAFTRNWLTEVRRVMKPDGAIWVSGTYHNIMRVGVAMQDLGFWVLNMVTWHKRNGMPNFRGSRFKNDVEYLLWAKYSRKSRYTFHHHLMKQFNDFSPGKQAGSVWQIHTCSGEERLKDTRGRKLHPTQKPEELAKRMILAASNPGDTVLDPFMGTGTTIAVARKLLRRGIGIERERRYYRAAVQRIALVQPIELDHYYITEAMKTRPSRIPFKNLIAAGYLRVGQTLYLDRPRVEATILPNGNLASKNGVIDSIHGLGRHLKGAVSCNGWIHWHYIDEKGKRRKIDELRQRYRAEYPNA